MCKSGCAAARLWIPCVPTWSLPSLFPSCGSGQLSSEGVLGLADFVQQFVERFRRESLACGQRPQHVYQEQANPKNLRERWIVGVSAQFPEDYIPHPFAPCHTFCSRELIEELNLLFSQLEAYRCIPENSLLLCSLRVAMLGE